MADDKTKKPGLFQRTKKFFKDLKSELKKIVWPSRKQVVNNTGIVIVCVLVSGAVIWGLDAIFRGLLTLVSAI